MNYQSGDNSKLGKKLSNRYLGSDAFTSSAGRFGGRTVSRLGSILKKGGAKKYYGVGQQVGLFEFKNSIGRWLMILVLLCILAYSLPLTRYAVHRFFTKNFALPATTVEQSGESLLANEAYVAPQMFKTDMFVGRQPVTAPIALGTFVYNAIDDVVVGTVSAVSTSTFEVVLFSDSDYKGNFFIENTQSFADESEDTEVETVSTSSTPSTTTVPAIKIAKMQTIAFVGVGYGQMLAKIPPQTTIEIGTQLFASTPDGLKATAQVTHVEPDAGSAFTLVYAQLLVPPTHIYKIRTTQSQNE